MPFSKILYHVETSQPICKANKLTALSMVRVFTKRYFQADCSIFLKKSLFSPRLNLSFTTLCDIVQVRYFFTVSHSPHKVLIPETILT